MGVGARTVEAFEASQASVLSARGGGVMATRIIIAALTRELGHQNSLCQQALEDIGTLTEQRGRSGRSRIADAHRILDRAAEAYDAVEEELDSAHIAFNKVSNSPKAAPLSPEGGI